MGSTPKKRVDELSVEFRQLAQRDRELDLKEREITKSAWSNPLIATLAAGVLAIVGNIAISVFNGQAQRDVEQEKARGNLLLEAIKTGDLKSATCNLDFLVDAGLLETVEYPNLSNYIEKMATKYKCEGAVLPSPEVGRNISATCNISHLPTDEAIAAARVAAEQAGTLPWMSIALGEIGVCERTLSGKERISEYWATLPDFESNFSADAPWSATFVNWVFQTAGIQTQNSAAGYDWEKWGEPASSPMVGSLVIAMRAGSNDPSVRGPRHIGFYMGERDGRVLVLGGNVVNQVSVSPIPMSRIVAYRNPPKQTGE